MKSTVFRSPRTWARIATRTTRLSSRNVGRRGLRATCAPRIRKLPIWIVTANQGGIEAATKAEKLANRRRWEESGNQEGSEEEWKWTLNWDEITDEMIIGSCPRSVEDVDRIVDESGATAILSLQCDLCLEALKIDYGVLRQHGLLRGIMMTRVPIRDFDHGDQTLMLPEAVRTLALLLALDYKVYVHCTAGINRATLTVLGYLTFVQGWDLYSALKKIRKARPQANPYIDCWKAVKTRLLEGRSEEVIALSRKFFLKNENSSNEGDSFGNWYAAEDLVIKETFRKLLSNSIAFMTDLTDLKVERTCGVCITPDEYDRANKEIENLQYELTIQRQRLAEARASLDAQAAEHAVHDDRHSDSTTPPYESVNGNGHASVELDGHTIEPPGASLMVYDELLRVKKEVSALKICIRKIAMVSTEALSIDSVDSFSEWEDDNNDEIIDLHEADPDEEQEL